MPTLAQIGVGYVIGHFTAYALVFRRRPLFQSEAGIFLLHAGSFAILLMGLVALACTTVPTSGYLLVASLAFCGSVHGLYSLSFLEIWSLTEGSYSLTIVKEIARSKNGASRDALQPLGNIGFQKSSARHSALISIGLIRIDERGSFKLTPLGAVSAVLIKALLRFSGGRPLNQ